MVSAAGVASSQLALLHTQRTGVVVTLAVTLFWSRVGGGRNAGRNEFFLPATTGMVLKRTMLEHLGWCLSATSFCKTLIFKTQISVREAAGRTQGESGFIAGVA